MGVGVPKPVVLILPDDFVEGKGQEQSKKQGHSEIRLAR
jgi:hypothetical protein